MALIERVEHQVVLGVESSRVSVKRLDQVLIVR